MNNISVAAQNLLNRANNLSTRYFQEFTRVIASKEYDFIACIEGNDQPYYIISCSNYLKSDNVYFLRCNGKKNVTDLIDILENSDQDSYRKSNCFGLVDNDYGLDGINLYPHRIYVTPSYSFENFYLSLSCLRKILEAHFNIKKFNEFFEDYQRILDNYTNRLNDYVSLIKEIDKRYRATQFSSKKYDEKLPNFHSADIIFSPIKLDLNSIYYCNGLSLNSCFKKDISLSYTQISYSDADSYYQHSDLWKYTYDIRGKFLIPFLCNYLRKLIDDINNLLNPICFVQRNALKRTDALEKQFFYKVQLSFDNNTILSTLAQYADQPDCLKTFLSNFMERATQITS